MREKINLSQQNQASTLPIAATFAHPMPGTPHVKSGKSRASPFNGVAQNAGSAKSADPTCYNVSVNQKETPMQKFQAADRGDAWPVMVSAFPSPHRQASTSTQIAVRDSSITEQFFMATGQEIDEAARKMHNAALALYVTHMDASENKDADVQCAAINGLIAAAAQILWDWRLETSTPESLAGKIHFAALDLLRQLKSRQQPN